MTTSSPWIPGTSLSGNVRRLPPTHRSLLPCAQYPRVFRITLGRAYHIRVAPRRTLTSVVLRSPGSFFAVPLPSFQLSPPTLELCPALDKFCDPAKIHPLNITANRAHIMANSEHERRILEALEAEPHTTQAKLAAQLGVAVGTVNWYLKRLINKGYVKTKQLERRNLKYFVTPAGLALKAKLTREYVETSLKVYRELRQGADETLAEVIAAGYGSVALDDDGSETRGAMDILRLTCLERGVTPDGSKSAPRVRSQGRGFTIVWPEQEISGMADAAR